MKTLLRAALAATALAVSMPANADVVDFSGFTPINAPQSTFSYQGLTFTNGGTFLYVWNGSSPNSNATNNLIFAGYNATDTMTITKTGGGLFDLNSFHMAISWYDTNPAETITVNGVPLVLTQSDALYNVNLLGVSSVTISGVSSNTGYWTADDFVFNAVAAVPEPATWGLMILGFGAVGGAMRRRGTVKTMVRYA